MSLWLFERVRERARFLREHRRCRRCGLYYKKLLPACNFCSELSDTELQQAIGRRRAFRMTLGKGMMLAAVLILLVMVVLASR